MTPVGTGLHRPRAFEIAVLLAFVWGEILLLLLQRFPAPTFFLEAAVSQAFFALAALHVIFSRRLYWLSIGLSRTNLLPSLALGVLYALIVVVPQQVAVSLGFQDPGTLIGGEPSRLLGPTLAFLLYLPFWGIFESV